MKREFFSNVSSIVPIPYLLKIQKDSFFSFLQRGVASADRKCIGLAGVFDDVFPIVNSSGKVEMTFLDYDVLDEKCTEDQARIKDINYCAPIKITVRLSSRNSVNEDFHPLCEQDVILCDLPLLTDSGLFIINGAERVVVSQMHRAPGIIFEEDIEESVSFSGDRLYTAKIVPYRGSWLEFSFDINNTLVYKSDRGGNKRKKVLITTLLRALGLSKNEDILRIFYDFKTLDLESSNKEDVIGKVTAKKVIDLSTGEVILSENEKITEDHLDKMLRLRCKSVEILIIEDERAGVIHNTLAKDTCATVEQAQHTVYKSFKYQDYLVLEHSEDFFKTFLGNEKRCDFTHIGRYRILKKYGLLYDDLVSLEGCDFKKVGKSYRGLCIEDILVSLRYLVALYTDKTELKLRTGKTIPVALDDIDNLGNRRVRSIGELLENHIRMGLVHTSRLAIDKMNSSDISSLTPRYIFNTAPLFSVLKKFFGSSQLSQFADQTNPLSELTHKRRLSALGPGGFVDRKRAGFSVRDVHYTHYGRLCPSETPEGANIGLIVSLASFARILNYGLIETPYRKVVDGVVLEKVDYLTADEEGEFIVAQSNAELDKNGRFVADSILCRHKDDFFMRTPLEVDYMNVSSLQVVSISTSMIPFLEHDDANRALMGSNMQRQAVPVMETEFPFVSTGVEEKIAVDTGSVITSQSDGVVLSVSADMIYICSPQSGVDTSEECIYKYPLRKYIKSNQDTCINFIPTVKVGDVVKKGDYLADGASTSQGQLSLGKHVLVGFMAWHGYNYEDSILLSERLVQKDIFTSLHIQEFKIEVRETKLGSEEITSDLPNVSKDQLVRLDEHGVVNVGEVVTTGDILVGKVAPQDDQQSSPEEKLLRLIFNKKSENVSEVSLKVPPGVSGKVLAVQTFFRVDKSSEGSVDDPNVVNFASELNAIKERKKKTMDNIDEYYSQISGEKSFGSLDGFRDYIEKLYDECEKDLQSKIAYMKNLFLIGDSVSIMVNKIVKVYLIIKRKIQVGDKMAGRHGNKGVVGRILPQEDMPYLPDGTPLDVVLSPLSIPSRMNVGQILESMLGWAGKILDTQMVTCVFDGAREHQVVEKVQEAKQSLRKQGVQENFLPDDYCLNVLYDGLTGQPFHERVTVGYMYMLKLDHMVEDKVHARSTGPYSMITRQPLGGKAQFGGQRFGEMEVWAVEGYGASYTLQEFLTVKSDDVVNRTKMYELIIKGEISYTSDMPESFKVLVYELAALGLGISL